MALYSVWDWQRNAYKVFSTPTPVSVGDDPLPPRPSRISPIGADPDMDVKPLPSGAKFVGHDHMCRGEIRRAPAGFGDLGDDAGSGSTGTRSGLLMFSLGLAAATAYFWWRDAKVG